MTIRELYQRAIEAGIAEACPFRLAPFEVVVLEAEPAR